MTWLTDAGFKVVVAGGSIGGLAAGITLRAMGAEVDIYESNAGRMETRGAGIAVQSDLLALLREHGAPVLPMTSCSVCRYLNADSGDGTLQPMPQQFTSWEAIYLTLRQMFPEDRYHAGQQISSIMSSDAGAVATVEGLTPIQCDLLVAADGANSRRWLRRRFRLLSCHLSCRVVANQTGPQPKQITSPVNRLWEHRRLDRN